MQPSTVLRNSWGEAVRASLRRHGRWILPAILALIVGLGVGRFTGYTDEPSVAPAPAAATTPADQIAGLERATAERPDDPAAWRNLGTAYVQQAAITGNPAFYDLASRAVDRAVALDPEATATTVAQSVLAMSLHEFEEANRLASAAVAAEPMNPDALAVLVDAQIELGRYEAAAATLQTLLDVRPALPALARTSYLRQLAGDLDGALTAARQAAAAGAGLTAATAQVTAIAGEVQLLRGDFEAAAATFEEASRLMPNLAAAELGQAKALLATGDPDAAVDTLDRLLDRQPTVAAAILLGEIHADAGRTDDADASFDLARLMIGLAADAGLDISLEAAWLEADHGDPALAVTMAETAYADRPTIFTADALAWAMQRDGRGADAVAYAREALSLGTLEPSIRIHSAAVLADAGLTNEAREVLAPAAAQGGWLTPSLVPVAQRLADELDIDLPHAWR